MEDPLALSDNEDVEQRWDEEQHSGHGGTAAGTVHAMDTGPKVTRHTIVSDCDYNMIQNRHKHSLLSLTVPFPNP